MEDCVDQCFSSRRELLGGREKRHQKHQHFIHLVHGPNTIPGPTSRPSNSKPRLTRPSTTTGIRRPPSTRNTNQATGQDTRTSPCWTTASTPPQLQPGYSGTSPQPNTLDQGDLLLRYQGKSPLQ
ncbi:unnamed protein product [Pleuronectes platessa]|uniref:Uncharacterized protein n=1 Tax=Pleuronectes platessa TaxID=8262 RepID=A0A9N7YMJ4_PLEPL|nr:unnamed protein product [Pleuronectes platessa]